jgi:predicted DNA-binding transcriptional regulator YafY
VEPFEFTTNMIDVWCYDLEKKENKVFKISRIGEVRVLEEEWSEEEAHRKSITDCFRMSGFEQTPVKLEMGIMAKNLLLEEYPLAEKDLKKEDDRWILETMVSDMAGVGRFVIGLAHDIKVIDSPELVEYIRLFVTKHLQ